MFRSCVYTEESFAIPEELRSAEIVFTKDTRQAIGKSYDYGCLAYIGKIEREIVPPDKINEETINLMYEHRGLRLEAIPARSHTYHIKKIFAVTKHGITTVDSGPGPDTILVLSDEGGQLYDFAAVFFSENGAEWGNKSIATAFINGKEYPLVASNFESFEPTEHFEWNLNPKVRF